ncbi:TPA: restriction endonuclease [Proteus mirabilis]|uniref:Restriction endonuclease n=1 Tax=Proteus mirabilis (strain HI4320) TaxID=529507 RepID=B4F0V4_PROMH|nr:restriction endonuclease [Proteus mirabilis]EKT8674713.1 restriction endonuclease [Proteus mirabilis]MBG3076637.1 restriction endonuclease [Proteus mirabilis]MBG3126075.1 restriction endonuclease [Proteus mirabilis]MBI6384438.1 restriction endonuclease [Proteus mirabilis]MBI6402178.1 restriction endonuclease [Proteus mirabilis]
MYWLFSKEKQKAVREKIDRLVLTLSDINHKPPHADQLFPFQGRKAINHAKSVIDILTEAEDTVCDPFSGSGSFAYAASLMNRNVYANEYEPYTYKMVQLPFNLPDKNELISTFEQLIKIARPQTEYYYRSMCSCGEKITIDSLCYDRTPLNYKTITHHERLGKNGENITFRGKFKCKNCGAKEKFFDEYDQSVMDEIEKMDIDFFDFRFIENSRINLGKDFLDYKNLFPKRSQIVSTILWNEILNLDCSEASKEYLKCTFLSVIPNMKYKDYRSKSQDLHCPKVQLRETNILNIFEKQFKNRINTIYGYSLNNFSKIKFGNSDYREFLSKIKPETIDLVITDPPWHDGSAYFERAQLYHPWLGYDLKIDELRLAKEVIVSNSPERPEKREYEQWWDDISELFNHAYTVLGESKFLVLYFRPVPANEWIANFNRLKLLARKNGFEPLLTIDLSNNDPSMRIQQSAHYAFSSDLILTFIKLSYDERRCYVNDYDLDELAYRCSVSLQDKLAGSFSEQAWKRSFFSKLNNLGLHELNLPKNRHLVERAFRRVCQESTAGQYLPRATSPYSDEIFNVPYIERVSLYIPYVIEELLLNRDKFTFDQFLLKVAEFVENGTRAILEDILKDGEDSIHSLLNLYAEPVDGGKFFTKRPIPKIPSNIQNLLELDPYEFEVFVAKILELEGYSNVVVSGRAGDRGVDVRCNNKNGDLVIVQCKRYTKSKIGSTPIQRLHSFANTRGAKEMICITTTDFTPDGYDEARLTGVRTIERNELEHIVHKHNIFHS